MPALIEKPKISRAMWDALKSHITKERQKKKQEQEQDAAIERMRKERENKQKQDVMTLEETKEQIVKMETKLEQLREEKHQLFLQLKKVLNEDETRRKARESDLVNLGPYQAAASIPIGGHPNMFLQSGTIAGRSPVYKVASAPQPNLIPPGALKRPRSPSPPPPAAAYSQPYNFKIQSVSSYNQKHGSYPSSQPSHYFAHHASQQPSQHPAAPSSYSTGSQVSSYTYTSHGGPPYPPTQPVPPQPQQQPQQQQQQQQQPVEQATTKQQPHHAYHIQHVPHGYIGPPMHQPIEHSPKPPFPEEKYYTVQQALQHPSVPIRGMSSQNIIHHTQNVIPIQQQPKQGGITSGYPIRTQPPPPPTSVYPVVTSTPQNVYSVTQAGSRHGYPSQPPPGRYY